MFQSFAHLARTATATIVAATLSTAAFAVELPGALVDSQWLTANLEAENLVVLDVRGGIAKVDAEGFAAGHVPGAVHAPYPVGWRVERDGIVGQLPDIADLEAHIGGLGISNDTSVVLVPAGQSATDVGSATRIFWTFKLLGHDNVAILNGGLRAWKTANGPLATGAATASAATFTASLRDELIVDTAAVEDRLKKGSRTVLLDGRPDDQFTGRSKHPRANRPGRIPGATQLDQSVFFNEADGTLLGANKAASLLPANVAAGDAEIVSYCNTGHWASMNWFVLTQVVGLENVTLYDDSMVGWSSDDTRPLAVGTEG